MISGPDRRLSRVRLPRTRLRSLHAFALLASLLLSACGAREVVISGEFPVPLVEPMPLHLGIWYPPEFVGHELYDEAKGRGESSWHLKSGEAQVQVWNQLFSNLFTRVTRLDAPPSEVAPPAGIDAVLIPNVDELQYAIPAHTNIKVYEIWLRYAFSLQQPDGQPIADWTMTAYGKTPTAFLQTDQEAVRLAGVVALRDAGAHFITSFPRVPEVAQWLESRLETQLESQPESPPQSPPPAGTGTAARSDEGPGEPEPTAKSNALATAGLGGTP